MNASATLLHMSTRRFFVSVLCLFALCLTMLWVSPAFAQEGEGAAPPQRPTVIKTIQVQGNQRIEANTIASYLLFARGDRYSDERIDVSVKTLYATGLFADVSIEPRDGNVLIRVIENPIINRVILEGNKALKSDKITDELEAEPRAIFTRSNIQADVQRIIELYRQSGRFAATVTPKVVQRAQNRVDLIFEIAEGPVTGIKRINFIGNKEFSDRQLRKEIVTEESIWYKFFSSNDNYDPGRLEFDREQIREFYTDRGFADFRVISAVAELTPDQEDFYITFTVDEGEEYTWGEIDVKTELETLDEDLLLQLVPITSGEIYKASIVETAIDSLTFASGTAGFAFVDIQPSIRRNRETKTVDLTFNMVEGPRVYIERIDIVGNTQTLDHVIRRELELVEGDAFNRILLDRSRNNVRRLRFFEDVEITETQGSTPDRANVEVKVTEQPTGELSFSAGFSSADAFLVDLSITQRNLRGRGQLLRFVVRASSNRREVDLRFTEPRFLGRNLAAGIELFDVTLDFIEEAGFRQSRRGGQVSFGFPLTENTSLSARYSLRTEDIEVPSLDCAAILSNPIQSSSNSLCLQEGGRLSSILGYTFVWDKRNDPITPTGGFDFRLSQDVAGIGGDVRYLRTDVRANFYKGIIGPVVGSLNLSGGYIQGWGGESVQINDRFFKGNNEFRGFDTAGVGPRVLVTNELTGEVQRGNALGGNLFALAVAEVSFPVGIPNLSASLFAEAGTVGLLDEEFQFETSDGGFTTAVVDDLFIRSTVGASVYWDSPFGPIRFDFTKPINEFDVDDRKSFQFTTSTRFN